MGGYTLKRNQVPFVLISILILLAIILVFSGENASRFFIVSVVIHSLLFFIIKKSLESLFLLTTSVFILGCAVVAHLYGLPKGHHSSIVFVFLSYAVILFCIWYVIQQSRLKKKIESSSDEKSIDNIAQDKKIYPLIEFMDRTASSPKSKNSCYLVIKIDKYEESNFAHNSIQNTIGNILLKNLPNTENIVGKNEHDTHIIFFSDIKKEEIALIKKQFQNELEKIVSVEELSYKTVLKYYK